MGYANEDTCKTKAAERSIYSLALQGCSGLASSCSPFLVACVGLRRSVTKIFDYCLQKVAQPGSVW